MKITQTLIITLEEIEEDDGAYSINVRFETDPVILQERVKKPDTLALKIGVATVNTINELLGSMAKSSDASLVECNKDGSDQEIIEFKGQNLMTTGDLVDAVRKMKKKLKEKQEAAQEAAREADDASSPSDNEPPTKRF